MQPFVAASVRNQSVLARHELGFQSLIVLTRSSQEQVQEDCARCYAHLSSNPENQVGVFTTDTYHSLFSLLASPVCNTARFAAMATGNLALVVVNSAAQERTFSVAGGGARFAYTLPRKSLATFVWQSRGPDAAP